AAPVSLLSARPPISAVFPSADSARLYPKWPAPTSPLPVSLEPCCVHVPSDRVKTQAAPMPLLSLPPPTSAVLPSADSATRKPNRPLPVSPPPVSLGPCCSHVDPERVKTQAAPTLPLSAGPPTSAVLPSAESATSAPNSPFPISSPP